MKISIAIASFTLALTLLVTPVFAQANPNPSPRKGGLSQSSLRSCMAREDAIKMRMTSLTNLTVNIERVFDSIAMKVENFYTNVVLPSGKSVSDYSTLVNNISAKKDQVSTDLSAAQSLVNSFSCSADDPRTLLTNFRTDMQKVKSDLHAYRTAIKNLIVAVRPLSPSASPEASESPEAKGTQKPEASETPEPTETPSPTASPSM